MSFEVSRPHRALAPVLGMLMAALLAAPTLYAQFTGADAAGAAGAAAAAPGRPDERTLRAMTNPAYMVTPGDIYSLSYRIGTSAVLLTLTIDSAYGVNLEAFGIESAKGLAFVEFKELVKDEVARAYPASWPQVSIASTGVFEVFLKGEVATSGYQAAWGLTRLSEVIRDNLTPYSSVRDVQVTARHGTVQTYDLYQSTRAGKADQDPFVRPGDTVVVRTYRRQVTISGEVRRPGTYQLLDGEHLQQLIEGYGDGFTRASLQSRVELVHADPSSGRRRISYLDFTRGVPAGASLEDGDAVTVPSIAQLVPVVYFQGALVPAEADPQERNAIYRQRYALREGETLVTALRSVAISPQADLTGCYLVRDNRKIFVDVDALLTRYDAGRDPVLLPLDTIVIPYVP